ncbi:MAG: rod shape-determining protein MreC [Muribaculaceae bacterium]|nr:rod shape-determining protein MreC [Muribaculaceae bacterium]
MRNLLNFLLKYSTWFVLTFYVLLSCILLFRGNSYQQSVFLTSANAVTGSVYGTASNVTGYFNLKQINEDLQERNAALENELLNLKNKLAEYQTLVTDTTIVDSSKRFDYITAAVVNNSVRHPRNYFTINKGSKDGIKPGMGVVDQNGIVGIVNVAGHNTARIISLLNETQHFSVKLKNTPYVGSLSWHGADPNIVYMEEVPRHVKYHVGDTVVTSGYSTTFPEGIPVGFVMAKVKGADDNFFTLKVRLASRFSTLSTVRIIKDVYKAELDSLQQFDMKTDD